MQGKSRDIEMADNEKKAVKAKDKKPSFWQGVKREWNKIIWPTKDDIVKRTALVIVASLIMGIIITVIDGAALYLLDLIMAI